MEKFSDYMKIKTREERERGEVVYEGGRLRTRKRKNSQMPLLFQLWPLPDCNYRTDSARNTHGSLSEFLTYRTVRDNKIILALGR